MEIAESDAKKYGTLVYKNEVIILVRVQREISNSGIYHVMIRGINRQNIFEDDEDRFKFLEILKHYKNICKYELYSYCLMSNHIHILIKELDDTISEAIRRIGASYVLWYNKKYDRSGHLFQGRFKSESVNDDGYFIRVLRYIHQNPIKAGMTKDIFETRWTSHYDYISKPNLIDTDLVLEMFSTDRNKAIDLYIKYMNEGNEDKFLDLEDKIILSDNDIIAYIKSLGVQNISTLQQMDRVSRDDIIKKVKKLEGGSLRQISRITGISKSVIGRI